MKAVWRVQRPHILIGLVLGLVLTGFLGYQLTSSVGTQALASNARVAKHLRALGHYKSKAVCDSPTAQRASCAAFVSTTANGSPLTGAPALTSSLGPTQFHTAYNLPCTPGGPVQAVCSTPTTYGPETVAIVDAGGFSAGGGTIESALGIYDTQYSLPACTAANGCLTVVNQEGATSPLPSSQGWDLEIALDVETVHMVCQSCKIVLVETNDNYLSNLSAGDVTAATFNPVAISNSWYATSIDDTSLDADFDYPGIAVVAATGDVGSTTTSWPADSPNVIGAAGTTLQLNVDNTWAGETVWSGSGGECSTTYAAPVWQTSLSVWSANGCGAFKAFGDLSADADPSSGAAVYTSSWQDIGGTSLATPLISGMFALAGGLQPGNNASSVLYGAFASSNSHDVTSGTNCANGLTLHCTATTGFDTPSGLGTPNGLNGFQVAPAIAVTATTGNINGTQVNLSWTASTNNSVGGYYIYRDGTKVGTVTSGTTFQDTGLTLNTSYSYDVVAYDAFNNVAAPSSTINITSRLGADINQDGHVNLLDLSLLASKYGQSGGGLGRADINQDGHVNLLDLSLLASEYGTE